MKKLSLAALVFILFTVYHANAQNEIINGVLYVNSTEPNTIRVENDAPGREGTIRFRSKPANGVGWLHADIASYATGDDTGFIGFKIPSSNAFGSGFDIVMDHNGRMGIGTTTPSHLLSVGMSDANFPTHWPTAIFKGGVIIGSDGNSSATYLSNQSENGIHGLNAYNYGTGQYLPVHIGWGNNDIYLAENGGHVGIGTKATNGYQLAVNGSIKSKEVTVEPTAWSDFVFAPDYELPSLEEVAQHISDNGHLPAIPSEAEVLEKGIDLGEMNANLLQKIEELTLYMIDMNKQLKSQNAKIGQLQKENAELKSEVILLKGQ